MKTATLKKSLSKYWQEIVFIVSTGILLFEVTRFSLLQKSFDGWDIATFSLTLPLFVCLVGQLYWNNKTLSIVLSVLSFVGAFIVILMALYFVGTTSSKLSQAISMLILGIFLLFTALTMAAKGRNITERIRKDGIG